MRRALGVVDRDPKVPVVPAVHGVNRQALRGSPGQTHMRVRGAPDGDRPTVVAAEAFLDIVHNDLEHVACGGDCTARL